LATTVCEEDFFCLMSWSATSASSWRQHPDALHRAVLVELVEHRHRLLHGAGQDDPVLDVADLQAGRQPEGLVVELGEAIAGRAHRGQRTGLQRRPHDPDRHARLHRRRGRHRRFHDGVDDAAEDGRQDRVHENGL
jgi:hypothetical protein